MLSFKPLTPQAMVEVEPLLGRQAFRSCDYTVGGLFMWREFFNERYAVVGDMLVCRVDFLDLGHCYTFPVGSGDIKQALLAIRQDAIERDIPLRFCCITEDGVGQLSDILGQSSDKLDYRDWADYLYTHESFCTYAGKKLVTQRNHCNRFVRDFPQYSYEAIDASNIDRVKSFFVTNEAHFEKTSALAREEYVRALEIMDYFDAFGFVGGILMVDGEVIGVTVGEVVADTLYVHIEKALTDFSGAYPMLASLFARQTSDAKVKFINREDDSGDDGLRRSKLMYRPVDILMKCVVSFEK